MSADSTGPAAGQGSREPSLSDLRQEIDRIDRELLQLLSQRARQVLEVARVKRRDSPDPSPSFYRPEREAQVLRNLAAANPGPLTDASLIRIYRQIMSACLALEAPLTIAYLGPEGTFTQMAAIKQFGDAVHQKPLSTVDDVFREVESEAANYGVVPVENSTEGVISHTLDNFLDSALRICGEVELRVHHNLMIGPGTDPAAIDRVYSHQQTLAQCRRWLDVNLPRVPRMALSSNAEAARRAAGEPGVAAIAGEIAAELYGLRVLHSRIEDRSDNTTRFLVIGREAVPPSGSDKTSLIVSTRNRPGALYRVLAPFHDHGISLTAIETRPSRAGRWSYVFFIDCEGHLKDPALAKVMAELEADAQEVKHLGSYPRALGSA